MLKRDWLDPIRFQQVFWNIFSNAVKFSHRGGTIEVALRRSPAALELAVTDHGTGIEPAFIESIFEKFSQVDASDSRQRGGTGLGLAISKELVERMHGSIGLASSPDEGSTFYFELPIATDDYSGA